MTPEIQAKLSQYMMTTGYYDLNAIAKDTIIIEDDPLGLTATFAAFFGDDNESPVQDNELLAAARAYNKAKSTEFKQTEAQSIPVILAKADQDITDDEWKLLMREGYATNYYISDAEYDWLTYRRTTKCPIPTLFADDTEENLVSKGL